jgi:hypothetical protein
MPAAISHSAKSEPIVDDLDKRVTILENKLENAERNLEKQALEYERRLGTLNHEAARLQSMQETYLPRAVYEAQYKGILEKIEETQKFIWLASGALLAIEFGLRFLGK